MTPESIYRIYSMTKPITSVALMMLYEEGHFLLENPVSRFLPEFADVQVWDGGTADEPRTRPPARPMTVHDVLTHQSGLTYGFHYQHPVDELYRNHGLGDFSEPSYSLAEGIELMASLPLLFDPGARWNYSMSTDVCGRLIEVMSGQPLDEHLRDHVLGPLGMTDTAFAAPESELSRCAPLYVQRSGQQAAGLRTGHIDGAATQVPLRRRWLGRDRPGLPPLLPHAPRGGSARRGPAARARARSSYMARNHLPGGKLLNDVGQSTFSESAMEGMGFGLGFSTVEDAAALQNLASEGEYSWGGAASTAFWVDPAEDICVVFMTQLLPSDTYPIRRQLRAAVLQAIVD